MGRAARTNAEQKQQAPGTAKFTLRALAVALVKAADLHDGHWMPAFEFANSATNMRFQPSPGAPALLTPAAVSFITGVRLVRLEEPNDLTVDAAEVNPERRIVMPPSLHLN